MPSNSAQGMVDEMVAALSFNVAGLDIYGPEVYDDRVFFVGPCFSPETSRVTFAEHREQRHTPVSDGKAALAIDSDEVGAFLDAAQAEDGEVLYINFGSIFYFTSSEYQALIDAIIEVRSDRPSLRAIIKVPKLPQDMQPLPPPSSLPDYILSSTWLPSITAVLSHPAVKIAVHHGGGNSFNEAVYYGLPQLIVSQWGETHDIASYGVAHGISKSVASAPKLVKAELVDALVTLLADRPKYHANALRWKIRCSQAGGTQAAANVIEAYASKEKRSAE